MHPNLHYVWLLFLLFVSFVRTYNMILFFLFSFLFSGCKWTSASIDTIYIMQGTEHIQEYSLISLVLAQFIHDYQRTRKTSSKKTRMMKDAIFCLFLSSFYNVPILIHSLWRPFPEPPRLQLTVDRPIQYKIQKKKKRPGKAAKQNLVQLETLWYQKTSFSVQYTWN